MCEDIVFKSTLVLSLMAASTAERSVASMKVVTTPNLEATTRKYRWVPKREEGGRGSGGGEKEGERRRGEREGEREREREGEGGRGSGREREEGGKGGEREKEGGDILENATALGRAKASST